MLNSLSDFLREASEKENPVLFVADHIQTTYSSEEIDQIFEDKNLRNLIHLFLIRKKQFLAGSILDLFNKAVEQAKLDNNAQENSYFYLFIEISQIIPNFFVLFLPVMITNPDSPVLLTKVFQQDLDLKNEKIDPFYFANSLQTVKNASKEFIQSVKNFTTRFVPDFQVENFQFNDEKIQNLEAENKELKSFLTKLQQDSKSYQEELETVNNLVQDQKQELIQKQIQLQETIQNYQNTIEEMKQQIRESQERTPLTNNINNLINNAENIENTKINKEQRNNEGQQNYEEIIKKLQDQIKEQQQQIDYYTKKSENNQLKETIEAIKTELNQIQREKEEQNDERQQIIAENITLKQTAQNIKQKLKAIDADKLHNQEKKEKLHEILNNFTVFDKQHTTNQFTTPVKTSHKQQRFSASNEDDSEIHASPEKSEESPIRVMKDENHDVKTRELNHEQETGMLHQLQQENNSLKDFLKDLQEQIISLQNNEDEFASENENAPSISIEQQKEVNQENSQLKDIVSDLQKQLDKSSDKNRISELEEQNKSLCIQLQEFQQLSNPNKHNQENAHEEPIESQVRRKENAQSNQNNSKNLIQQLQDKIDQFDQDNENQNAFQEQVRSRNQDIVSLQDQINKLQHQNTNLTQLVHEIKETLIEIDQPTKLLNQNPDKQEEYIYQAEIQRLKNDIKRLTITITEKDDQIQNLQQLVQSEQISKKVMESQEIQLPSSILNSLSQISNTLPSDANVSLINLSVENERLKTSVMMKDMHMKQTITSTNNQIQKYAKQLKDLNDEHHKLKMDSIATEENYKYLTEKYEVIKRDNVNQSTENIHLRESLRKAQEDNEECIANITKETEDKINSLVAIIKGKNDDIVKLKNAYKELVAKFNGNLSEQSHTIASKLDELHREEARIGNLRKKQTELHEREIRYKNQIKELQQENSELHESVSFLKSNSILLSAKSQNLSRYNTVIFDYSSSNNTSNPISAYTTFNFQPKQLRVFPSGGREYFDEVNTRPTKKKESIFSRFFSST